MKMIAGQKFKKTKLKNSKLPQDDLRFPLLKTVKIISYMLKYFSNFVLG